MRISAGFIPAGTSRSKSREDARHAQGRPTGRGSSTNYSAGQLPSRTSIGVRSKFAILSRPIRRLILTCVRRLELWQALMGNQTRREHLVRFYSILDDLQHKIGGAHKLADCSGRMDWPKRGVYFFHEQGEKSFGYRRRSEGRPRWNARPKGRVPNETLDAFVSAQRPAENRRRQSPGFDLQAHRRRDCRGRTCT